jgi:hypothetical protein
MLKKSALMSDNIFTGKNTHHKEDKLKGKFNNSNYNNTG